MPKCPKGSRTFDTAMAGNIAVYRAMIEAMDRNIGLALDALRATGRDRDTIVVFTSDNGGERFSKSWPFNGRKGELLEGGIRVPLLVRWPARIAAGSTSSQVAATMDWAPTFLAAAAIAPSLPLDGISLLPALTGSAAAERTLFWRHKAYDQQAVRRGAFKYLSVNKQDYLFDLSRDPQEMADLKERRADLFRELQAAWKQWNAQMLAYPKDSYSDSSKGVTADRY
jgi:arylsulfatase A-like enzyme